MVESTVGKGEIARHEEFLLLPQSFLKTCNENFKHNVFFLERVNQTQMIIENTNSERELTLSHSNLSFDNLKKKGFDQHFLLPECFLPCLKQISSFGPYN